MDYYTIVASRVDLRCVCSDCTLPGFEVRPIMAIVGHNESDLNQTEGEVRQVVGQTDTLGRH